MTAPDRAAKVAGRTGEAMTQRIQVILHTCVFRADHAADVERVVDLPDDTTISSLLADLEQREGLGSYEQGAYYVISRKEVR